MNSLSYGINPYDILDMEPEVIINEDGTSSNSTFRRSPSPSSDSSSSPRFKYIKSIFDGDSMDSEASSARFEWKTAQTEWLPVLQKTNIQINGSVVIVPPVTEEVLVQKKQLKDDGKIVTMAKQNLAITSAKQNCRPRISLLPNNSMTSMTGKLARNGVTIVNNESERKGYHGYPRLKMKSILATPSSSSARYNPFLSNPTPDPKTPISYRGNRIVEESRKLSEPSKPKIQPKGLFIFSDSAKVSKRFVCNFCDRLFKTLEYLQSHHEVHGISYWTTPYSWMEDETVTQETYQGRNEFRFMERPKIEEGVYDEEFTCQVCDMVFASAGGLSRHMDVHRIPYLRRLNENRREYISEEGHAMIDLTD